MIDYIKAHFSDKDGVKNFVLNNMETFDDVKNLRSEKYKENDGYSISAKMANMELRFTPHTGYIRNSIHKYYNKCNLGDLQNHNDFKFSDMCQSITDIDEKLDCDAEDMRLTMLEFGLNIELQEEPKSFIDNNVVMYDFKPFSEDIDTSLKRMKKYQAEQFEIKIYSKKLQYGLSRNILRVELKITKTRYLNKLGIYNLQDLRNKENLKTLYKTFLSRLEPLLLVDHISYLQTAENPANKTIELKKYLSDHYWTMAKQELPISTLGRRKKACESLVKSIGLDTKRKEFFTLLDLKFWELMEDSSDAAQEVYRNVA
jgi:hypothetical protein